MSETKRYYFECPNCSNDERFSELSENSGGLGCALFFFGGIIPALLYADATRNRIQCPECGNIFRQPPLPRTALSRVALLIICTLLLCPIIVYILASFPEFVTDIALHPWLSYLERAISNNAKPVMLVLVFLFPLLFLMSLLASWVSNYSAHEELRKKHKTCPTTFPDAKEKRDHATE